jgi:hypothetical protein
MVSAFRFIVVWGVSLTTGGSVPLKRHNPRSSRRADTAFGHGESRADSTEAVVNGTLDKPAN